MLTAQQYRVKAAEYAGLADTARSDSEGREFRALERNRTSLAANKEWLAGDGTAPVSSGVDRARAEEEQILRSFGTAVIIRWNTLPKRVQRELFAHAGYIGDLQQLTEPKGQIARFLHHHVLHRHRDDAHKSVHHG